MGIDDIKQTVEDFKEANIEAQWCFITVKGISMPTIRQIVDELSYRDVVIFKEQEEIKLLIGWGYTPPVLILDAVAPECKIIYTK